MKYLRNKLPVLLACMGMLALILDAKTALTGAGDGIQLVIHTVLPSLFPFIFLSCFLNSGLLGTQLRILQPVCQLCGVPKGCDSLLLLGLVGGYPVGAQAIANAYRDGCLDASSAHRLLGFCNNAGPAFVFGMLTPMFTHQRTVWALWLIHMTSALLTGILLPRRSVSNTRLPTARPITVAQALQQALRIAANISAWVVLFRILIAFCTRWFFWLLPKAAQVLICGILELSNGCCELASLPAEGTRFLLSAALLSFGGLCVGMQTVSVTQKLGTGMYYPGKILQTAISVILAILVQPFLFSSSDQISVPAVVNLAIAAVPFILLVIWRRRKKVVAIPL